MGEVSMGTAPRGQPSYYTVSTYLLGSDLMVGTGCSMAGRGVIGSDCWSTIDTDPI